MYLLRACLQIPFTMGQLSSADIAQIAQHGPYTEDYRNLLPVLHPNRVTADLSNGLTELLELVSCEAPEPPKVDEDSDTDNQCDATHERLPTSEKEITDRICARPNIDTGGPTAMKFLPSIPKCDTKAYVDVFKFFPILLAAALLSAPQLLVLIVFGDGQTVEILRACKRTWPQLYKRVLIGNGHFHSFAHFCFALNRGFWRVKSRLHPHTRTQACPLFVHGVCTGCSMYVRNLAA